MTTGAPTNVLDYMTAAQKADVLSNTGSIDVTTEIQAALDASQNVYMPAGTYLTSAMLKLHDNQILFGDGSTVSLIKNETSDCLGKDDVNSADNYFQVKKIGCTKTFDATSTSVAFNFTNTTYIVCEDLAATNFYTALLLKRSSTSFGNSNACWYSVFKKLIFRECGYGVFIDNENGTIGDVNGCFFEGMIFTTLNYDWIQQAGMVTSGIKYSGYGNVFRDGYIQGFSHHIWRTTGFGDNLLEGLYIESEVVPGQAAYFPTAYAGNKDTYVAGHFDTFTQDPIYDPYNTLYLVRPGGATYQRVATATLPASTTSTLTITMSSKTAQFQIVGDVGGYGSGSVSAQAQGVLSNSLYYDLITSTPFSYSSITMGTPTKGNGTITVTIDNAHTSNGTITVTGICDGSFSIAVS